MTCGKIHLRNISLGQELRPQNDFRVSKHIIDASQALAQSTPAPAPRILSITVEAGGKRSQTFTRAVFLHVCERIPHISYLHPSLGPALPNPKGDGVPDWAGTPTWSNSMSWGYAPGIWMAILTTSFWGAMMGSALKAWFRNRKIARKYRAPW